MVFDFDFRTSKTGESSTTPMEDLANEIIIYTCKDYRKALRDAKRARPGTRFYFKTHKMISDCERFFLGDWFAQLTELDGKTLMNKLREEAKYD